MKTKIVPGADISAEKGLRAQDYIRPNSDDFAGLAIVAKGCFETAESKGWWENYRIGIATSAPTISLTPDQMAAKLCLIHSEVSEALEEIRENDGELYMTAPPKEKGGMRRIVPESEFGEWKLGDLKPEGLPSELADIVIRVFDLAGATGIDIAAVIQQKMAYNERRAFKHGGKKL